MEKEIIICSELEKGATSEAGKLLMCSGGVRSILSLPMCVYGA